MMRSVSFVDRLELEFSGNHFSQAITLGDVDSDGANELVIGNVDGVLAIFKGKASTPLNKCSGLGTITCVGVGDLLNIGKNVIVCVNTEGICHLFDIRAPGITPISTSSVNSSSSGEQLHRGKPKTKPIKPLHTQTLPTTNIKTMCIAPVACQGWYNLFVGHTDRCIAVYHWSVESKSLILVKKFALSGQVGSLSVSVKRDDWVQLLVSQPGGTYVPLRYKKEPEKEAELVQCDLVGQAQRRNPTSSTEIVGNIIDVSFNDTETTTQQGDVVALCTLDGIIRMLKDEVKQWELQVDHSLFAIEKLDVTGSGSDEIVVCAWDGMTYIVDLNRNIVRYKFEQNVSAFTAGYYGLSDYGKDNKPCLVYSTFSNRIFIYHNITLPAVPSSNLFDISKGLHEKVDTLDDCSKQKLFQETLYNFKPCPSTA